LHKGGYEIDPWIGIAKNILRECYEKTLLRKVKTNRRILTIRSNYRKKLLRRFCERFTTLLEAISERHDTQHNDIQYNGTQQNDTQHNDTLHNDVQFNDTQHNDTQPNDIQYNDTQHYDTQHYDT
jgi:hypothetical protein